MVRKDWASLFSPKARAFFLGGPVVLIVFLCLLAGVVMEVPRAVGMIIGRLLGFLIPMGISFFLSPSWIMIAYYLLDACSWQERLIAFRKALTSWVVQYPVYMLLYLSFLLLQVAVALIPVALIVLKISVHLLAIVWYAAALAVYYESICYRQE